MYVQRFELDNGSISDKDVPGLCFDRSGIVDSLGRIHRFALLIPVLCVCVCVCVCVFVKCEKCMMRSLFFILYIAWGEV